MNKFIIFIASLVFILVIPLSSIAIQDPDVDLHKNQINKRTKQLQDTMDQDNASFSRASIAESPAYSNNNQSQFLKDFSNTLNSTLNIFMTLLFGNIGNLGGFQNTYNNAYASFPSQIGIGLGVGMGSFNPMMPSGIGAISIAQAIQQYGSIPGGSVWNTQRVGLSVGPHAVGQMVVYTPNGQRTTASLQLFEMPIGVIIHGSTAGAHVRGAYNGGYRYNYGIDNRGNIFLLVAQGTTSHIRGPKSSPRMNALHKRPDLASSNTISITLLDTDNAKTNSTRFIPSIRAETLAATRPQLHSLQVLLVNLKRQFNGINAVYGHGEIQTTRKLSEGLDGAQLGRRIIPTGRIG